MPAGAPGEAECCGRSTRRASARSGNATASPGSSTRRRTRPVPAAAASSGSGGRRAAASAPASAALPRGVLRARADRLARPDRAGQVRAFVRSIDDNLDAGRGLWFDGPSGTGKTSLAILVAKAAKDAGRSYAVYPVPRLLAEIKRTFDRDSSDNYLAFFRRLCSVDVLVLDDLGAEKQTEWVLEQLYSIVNERWQDRRSIVVTTNLPDPDPERPAGYLRRARASSATRRGRTRRRPRHRRPAHPHRAARARDGEVGARGRGELDPIARLRKQIGARTVSRLMEICDDPIPIQGPDLRMAAQGAIAAPGHLDSIAMPGLVIVGAQWGDEGQGQGRRPARRAGRPRDPLPGRQQRRPHHRPGRRDLQVPPDPVGDPLPRQAVRDRQRRGRRPEGAHRRDRRAARRRRIDISACCASPPTPT